MLNYEKRISMVCQALTDVIISHKCAAKIAVDALARVISVAIQTLLDRCDPEIDTEVDKFLSNLKRQIYDARNRLREHRSQK